MAKFFSIVFKILCRPKILVVIKLLKNRFYSDNGIYIWNRMSNKSNRMKKTCAFSPWLVSKQFSTPTKCFFFSNWNNFVMYL